MATTYIEDIKVFINKSRLIEFAPNYICTPGQLLAKNKDGFLIKTADNFLEIYEIESDQMLKVGYKLGR